MTYFALSRSDGMGATKQAPTTKKSACKGASAALVANAPSVDELDAFYRYPSGLSPERLAFIEEFVEREKSDRTRQVPKVPTVD